MMITPEDSFVLNHFAQLPSFRLLPMIYPAILVFLTLAILRQVQACETECKDGVTKVFVSNYSSPVHQVFRKLVCHLLRLLLD
jgi:hypothetical protein